MRCAEVWVIEVGLCILASLVFVCSLGIKDQFLGKVIQYFSHMFLFTVMEPLSVDESPYLFDELIGPF